MDDFEAVVVVGRAESWFGEHPPFDLKFGHLQADHKIGHDIFFVQQFALPLIEGQPIEHPPLTAVMQCRSLGNKSNQSLVAQTSAALDLTHDAFDV